MEKRLEIIDTAKEYMPNLVKGMETTLNLLREGNIVEGNNLLIQVVEGLDWVIEMMIITEGLHKHKIDTGTIRENVRELVEGLQNKDYTLVSDVLEYELIVRIEEWQEVLKTLK